ncbi:MAG: hypothetical protein NT079_04660 [Candidatus Omnitrophica bacterium]|nr:hypothetical protein [Candidatus Omnitrophota bacterium]
MLNIRPGHDWGDDFAAYIHHAKNIATGHPYADINFIQNPFNRIAPSTYPPAFPLFLSVVYGLFGMNLFAMKILVILFWLGALSMMVFLFRTRIPSAWLALLLLSVGTHPFLRFFLNNILSETIFLFFSLLSIYFAEYLYANKINKQSSYLFFIALGFIIYLVYATRVIGAIFIPLLIVYDFIKHKRFHKETFFAVMTCAILITFQKIVGIDATGFFLLSDFHLFAIPSKAMFCVKNFYFSATTGREQFLLLAKSFLGIIGFCMATRRGIDLVDLFALFYGCVILAYAPLLSFFDMVRYLVPLLPFCFYYILLGAAEIASVAIKRLSIIILIALFFIIIGSHAMSVIAGSRQQDFSSTGVAKKESVELFEYIKKNTNPQDVFIFIKPRALTLFTDRPASVYYAHKNRQDFLDYLVKIKARYIVIMRGHDLYLEQLVKAHEKNFLKVYENSDFQVFKFLIF